VVYCVVVSMVALDVSGSVNVSGTITTGNSCSLMYWKVIGNLPSAGNALSVALPTGCSSTNVVAAYGGWLNGSTFFPFNNTFFQAGGNSTWEVSLYLSSTVNIDVASSSTNASSKPFTVIIVTTS